MSSNRTCEWKAMIIRISWEPPLFNFKRLDIICPRIRNPSEKLWPFEFLLSSLLSHIHTSKEKNQEEPASRVRESNPFLNLHASIFSFSLFFSSHALIKNPFFYFFFHFLISPLHTPLNSHKKPRFQPPLFSSSTLSPFGSTTIFFLPYLSIYLTWVVLATNPNNNMLKALSL